MWYAERLINDGRADLTDKKGKVDQRKANLIRILGNAQLHLVKPYPSAWGYFDNYVKALRSIQLNEFPSERD